MSPILFSAIAGHGLTERGKPVPLLLATAAMWELMPHPIAAFYVGCGCSSRKCNTLRWWVIGEQDAFLQISGTFPLAGGRR